MADDVIYDLTDPSEDPFAPEPAERPKVGTSLLDELRVELQKKVERPEVLIEVPERAGIKLVISPNITQHQMRAWRKNAGAETKRGLDPTIFACYVVGGCTRGILLHDEEVFSDQGAPLSFASPEILDMTDTTRPVPECVRAFFGIDPHVEAAALAVLEAAGFADDIEAVDPTRAD